MKMKTATIYIFNSPKPPTAPGCPADLQPAQTASSSTTPGALRPGRGWGLQGATDTLCLWDPTAFNSYTVPSAAFLPDTHSSCSQSHDNQLSIRSGLFLAALKPMIREKDTTLSII